MTSQGNSEAGAAGNSWWRRRSVIAASAVIVLIAGAGAAAAHSSSSVGTQTFAGCLTSAGALVDVTLSSNPSTSCPSGTTSVTWTQQGPAGDTGATGAIGSPGPVGKTGHAGPAGPTGAAGAAGPVGAQGLPGNAGKTGHAGTRGPQGPIGPVGPTGAIGPSGATGVTGTAGASLLHGSGAPTKAIGNIGDSYIDITTDLLYGPKTSSGWGTGVSLIGPPGPAGPGADAGEPAQCSSSSFTAVVTTADELTAALANAVPGAVIYVAPGTYTGAFTATGSGTQSAPITVCGSQDAILTDTTVTSGYVLHLLNANWWQFYGFTVENGQKGVMLDGSSNNLLDGLYVHDIGDEGVHFRTFSSNNTLSWSHIEDTGLREAQYGEGIYVGSAQSNWCDLTNCSPDTSNGNQILDNTVDDTPAENIDIKEGTTGGLVSGNRFDGAGIVLADASGWINVKGNSWLVEDNVGITSPQDGFQVHQVVSGWGRSDVFADNDAIVNGPGYGFSIQGSAAFNNIVYCSNTASGAAKGLSNITCTPGGP